MESSSRAQEKPSNVFTEATGAVRKEGLLVPDMRYVTCTHQYVGPDAGERF